MSERIANFCFLYGLDEHILTFSSPGIDEPEDKQSLMSAGPLFQSGPSVGMQANSDWALACAPVTLQAHSIPNVSTTSKINDLNNNISDTDICTLESKLKPATLLVKSALTLMNPHPLDRIYESKLLSRYPLDSQLSGSDKSFPQHLGQFCFPMQCKLTGVATTAPVKSRPDSTPKAEWHSFVITDNYGNKQHVICMTIYRPITESAAILRYYRNQFDIWKTASYSKSDLEYFEHVQEKLTETLVDIETMKSRGESAEELEDKCNLYNTLLAPFDRLNLTADKVYMPLCLGLIGNFPFYSFYRDWLAFIVNKFDFDLGKSEVPFERYLSHLFQEVPLPPPGQAELHIHLDDITTLSLSRPAYNQCAVSTSLPVYQLFCSLSLHHIVTVLEHVVVESKVLFVSAHLSMLNLAAELFTSLLYPLKWQHTYIPVLPIQLIEFIQAPFPFIIGIHSAMVRDSIPDDVLLVDLDRDALKMGMYSRTPIKEYFSTRSRRKLLSRLQRHCTIDSTQRQQFFTTSLIADARAGWWNRIETDSVQLTKEKINVKTALQKFEKTSHRKGSAASIQSTNSFWGFTGWNSNPLPSISALIISEKDESHETKNESPLPPKVPEKSPTRDSGSLQSVASSNRNVPPISRASSVIAISQTTVQNAQSSENFLNGPDIKITIDGDEDGKRYLETVSKSPKFPLKRLIEKKASDTQILPSKLSIVSSAGNSSHESTTSSSMPDYAYYFYSYKLNESSADTDHLETRWFHSAISKNSSTADLSPSFDRLSIHRVTCPTITHKIATTHQLKQSYVGGDPKTTLSDIKYHGHSLQSVLIMDESTANNGVAKYAFNNNAPLGWCAACKCLIKMPILRSAQSVMTKSGIAAVCDYEHSANNEVLQCSKCRLILHPDCCSTAITCQNNISGASNNSNNVPVTPCPASFDYTSIQVSIMRFWAGLLSTYKEHMVTVKKTPMDDDLIKFRMRMDNMFQRMRGFTGAISDAQRKAIPQTAVFDSDAFLAGVALDEKEFMSQLLATQSMTQFLYERADNGSDSSNDNDAHMRYFETLFFDEIITWRANKSMLSTKKTTPFLSDGHYGIASMQTIPAPKLDKSSRATSTNGGYFRIQWPLKEDLFASNNLKSIDKGTNVNTSLPLFNAADDVKRMRQYTDNLNLFSKPTKPETITLQEAPIQSIQPIKQEQQSTIQVREKDKAPTTTDRNKSESQLMILAGDEYGWYSDALRSVMTSSAMN